MEELVAQVKLARDQALAGRLAVTAVQQPLEVEETTRLTRTGGAFGGALKRRIAETDTATRYAHTNEADIYFLRPTNVNYQLFSVMGDQVYRGILLTPSEMGAVTFSANALSRRLSANVLDNTTERPASVRHARVREVLLKGLTQRAAAAAAMAANLAVDKDVFSTLQAKQKAPGYAHMRGYEMDALMAHAEGRFVDLIAAILDNHKLGTERVQSLTSALDYLLGNDGYQRTFKYWEHMTAISLHWTNRKIELVTAVQSEIDTELQGRR